MAERFGHWPWELEQQPADRVAYWMGILGAEGEAYALTEGVGVDEDIIEIE